MKKSEEKKLREKRLHMQAVALDFAQEFGESAIRVQPFADAYGVSPLAAKQWLSEVVTLAPKRGRPSPNPPVDAALVPAVLVSRVPIADEPADSQEPADQEDNDE